MLLYLLVAQIFLFPCLSSAKFDKQPRDKSLVNFDITSLLHSPAYGTDSLSFKLPAGNHSTLFFQKDFLSIPGSHDEPNLIAYTNDDSYVPVSFRLRSDVSQEKFDLFLNHINISFNTLSEISSGIMFNIESNRKIFDSVEILKFFAAKNKATPIGISYTLLTISRDSAINENLFALSDICHLTVPFSLSNFFAYSYGLFQDKMLRIVEMHEKFVYNINRGCVIYYQLHLMRSYFDDDDLGRYEFVRGFDIKDIIDGNSFEYLEQRRHYFLLASFAVTFAKEKNVRIILDSFHSGDHFKTWMTEKNLMKLRNHELEKDNNGLIIPFIRTPDFDAPYSYQLGPTRYFTDGYHLAKPRFTDLYILAPRFSSLQSIADPFFDPTRAFQDCPWPIAKTNSVNSMNIQLAVRTQKLDAWLLSEYPESLKDLFNNSSKQRKYFTLKAVTIEDVYSGWRNITITKEFIHDSKVPLSCGITIRMGFMDAKDTGRLNIIAAAIRDVCGIFKSGNTTILNLKILLGRINSIGDASKFFEEDINYIRNITLTLQEWNFNITSLTVDSTRRSYLSSFYCSPARNFLNELLVALINLSKVVKMPIKLQQVLGRKDEVSYFDYLETSRNLRNISQDCPVYVSRNSFVQAVDKTWMVDPCIYRTEKVPDNEIKFNMIFTGIIFNLADTANYNKSLAMDLSQHEIMIMMVFALHKFNKAELIVPTGAYGIPTLDNFIQVLTSQEFYELTQLNSISNISLYVDINLNALVQQSDSETFKRLQKGMNGISFLSKFAVHFSGWEAEIKSVDVELLRNLCNTAQTNFTCGLTIKNCALELNNFFGTLKDFFNDVQIQVTYIVCVEDAVIASNRDHESFEEYLDSHLYMKTMFQRAFPGISVHFHLQSTYFVNPSRKIQLDRFLRFVNDVDQFASLYNMNYFLLQAIETEKLNGWWKVEKSLQGSPKFDYANVSAYIDKESEFLGRETWRPKFQEESLNSEYSITTVIGIISAVSLMLIVGSLIFLSLYLGRKLKSAKKLLSNTDVKNFFDGVAEEFGNEMELLQAGDRDISYMRMKYNQDYEIPLENILFGNILLGSGNFGVVRQASIGARTVAVKIAKENSTAEAFKSLLMEVKIMMYVGNHENVVEFIGTCTKSIQNGVIYIVTEMCENGSLESYLRQKLSADQITDRLYKLHKFAEEIASGMDFIASKKIVHGDLSTRNVLLDSHAICKVADFGLSRKLDENGEYIKNTWEALPWRCMAIESLKERKFTTQSDIWSFGVTAWEIYSLGKVPYTGMQWSIEFVQSLEDGMRLTCPEFASAEIYDIMMRCWSASPDSRPSFSDLVTFIRQTGNASDYSTS